MLEATHGLRKCSKDCGFHNDHKATGDSKCTAVTEKLTPSEVKFKQKISHFCVPIISKRSRLDSDVVVKADTVTLSNNHSDYDPSQCSSKDSPLQIDDEDLFYFPYSGFITNLQVSQLRYITTAHFAESNTIPLQNLKIKYQ